MSEGEVSEEQFRVLEGVVYFVDPKSPESFSFLGGKERIRIPLKREHNSLDAFKRPIVEHAGLKTEAEKRGIGSSIDLKLCRLDLGCPGEVVESNRKRQEEENQKDTDDEQESEYDTESESELPATVDSDLEDEMTFLRAVTTRSGRTIRVTSKFF